MYIPQLVYQAYLSMGIHKFGYTLASHNGAPINMDVAIFFEMRAFDPLNSCSLLPRNEIAGSYDGSSILILRNCHCFPALVMPYCANGLGASDENEDGAKSSL